MHFHYYIEELKFPSTPEEIKVSAGRINDEMSAIYRGNWVECIHIPSENISYQEGMDSQKDLLKKCLMELLNKF